MKYKTLFIGIGIPVLLIAFGLDLYPFEGFWEPVLAHWLPGNLVGIVVGANLIYIFKDKIR